MKSGWRSSPTGRRARIAASRLLPAALNRATSTPADRVPDDSSRPPRTVLYVRRYEASICPVTRAWWPSSTSRSNPRGMTSTPATVAFPHEGFRFAHRCRFGRDPDGLVAVRHPDEAPAQGRVVAVDDGDRHVLHDLVRVRQRVEEGIHDHGQDGDDQDSAIQEDQARLVEDRPKEGLHRPLPSAAARDSRVMRQSRNGHGTSAKAASATRPGHDTASGAPRIPCWTRTRR